MYCEKCGSQIDDDSVFCQKCGRKQGSLGHNQNSIATTKLSRGQKNAFIFAIVFAIIVAIFIGIVISINGVSSGGGTQNSFDHSKCLHIGYVKPNNLYTIYKEPGPGLVALYSNSSIGPHIH